jgi:(p)ppGpp synthase/HD superfamily hydrolase
MQSSNHPLVLKAIKFANEKHLGQTRKSTGLPYIVHPHGVAAILQTFKRSKNLVELICACYLHDTLEDTNTTHQDLRYEFGDMVANLVVEMTNDQNAIKLMFGGSKLEYLKNKLVSCSSYALTLKLCDRLDNMMGQPTDKMVKDTWELLWWVHGRRHLSWTQQQLFGQIMRVCLATSPAQQAKQVRLDPQFRPAL